MFDQDKAPAWVGEMAGDIACGEFDEEAAKDYGLRHRDEPWRISGRELRDSLMGAGMDYDWAAACARAFWETAPAMPDAWTVAGMEEARAREPNHFAPPIPERDECPTIPTRDEFLAA